MTSPKTAELLTSSKFSSLIPGKSAPFKTSCSFRWLLSREGEQERSLLFFFPAFDSPFFFLSGTGSYSTVLLLLLSFWLSKLLSFWGPLVANLSCWAGNGEAMTRPEGIGVGGEIKAPFCPGTGKFCKTSGWINLTVLASDWLLPDELSLPFFCILCFFVLDKIRSVESSFSSMFSFLFSSNPVMSLAFPPLLSSKDWYLSPVSWSASLPPSSSDIDLVDLLLLRKVWSTCPDCWPGE